MRSDPTYLLFPILFLSYRVWCGPTHKMYFKPQAEKGAIFKEACGGQAGASNGIMFDEKKVKLWFTMALHNPFLLVEIFIKEPSQITFTSTKFVMTVFGEEKYLQLEKFQVIDDVKIATRPKKDLPIQDIIQLQSSTNTVYYLWFPIPLENQTKFSLTVPPLIINKESVSLPTIHWTQVEESFLLEKMFLWNC